MSEQFSPVRWAFELTHLLNTVLGGDHFPIDIASVALDYSAQRFRDDPILKVKGDNLPGFEGALYKSQGAKKGWGIFFNDRIRSQGRIRFTLAHEFGHYLLHRTVYPDGLACGEQDVVRWDSEYGQVEHQANVFAANILMPLDDFRVQIPDNDKADLNQIGHCADRYGVSMMAATLRWLSYTRKRAVLVVSRDGFILWARSSELALKSGAFFRTSAGPIEIPAASLALNPAGLVDGVGQTKHGPGVWFREPVVEMTLLAEQYDFSLSLLLLEDEGPRFSMHQDAEGDVVDKFQSRGRRA